MVENSNKNKNASNSALDSKILNENSTKETDLVPASDVSPPISPVGSMSESQISSPTSLENATTPMSDEEKFRRGTAGYFLTALQTYRHKDPSYIQKYHHRFKDYLVDTAIPNLPALAKELLLAEIEETALKLQRRARDDYRYNQYHDPSGNKDREDAYNRETCHQSYWVITYFLPDTDLLSVLKNADLYRLESETHFSLDDALYFFGRKPKYGWNVGYLEPYQNDWDEKDILPPALVYFRMKGIQFHIFPVSEYQARQPESKVTEQEFFNWITKIDQTTVQKVFDQTAYIMNDIKTGQIEPAVIAAVQKKVAKKITLPGQERMAAGENELLAKLARGEISRSEYLQILEKGQFTVTHGGPAAKAQKDLEAQEALIQAEKVKAAEAKQKAENEAKALATEEHARQAREKAIQLELARITRIQAEEQARRHKEAAEDRAELIRQQQLVEDSKRRLAELVQQGLLREEQARQEARIRTLQAELEQLKLQAARKQVQRANEQKIRKARYDLLWSKDRILRAQQHAIHAQQYTLLTEQVAQARLAQEAADRHAAQERRKRLEEEMLRIDADFQAKKHQIELDARADRIIEKYSLPGLNGSETDAYPLNTLQLSMSQVTKYLPWALAGGVLLTAMTLTYKDLRKIEDRRTRILWADHGEGDYDWIQTAGQHRLVVMDFPKMNSAPVHDLYAQWRRAAHDSSVNTSSFAQFLQSAPVRNILGYVIPDQPLNCYLMHFEVRPQRGSEPFIVTETIVSHQKQEISPMLTIADAWKLEKNTMIVVQNPTIPAAWNRITLSKWDQLKTQYFARHKNLYVERFPDCPPEKFAPSVAKLYGIIRGYKHKLEGPSLSEFFNRSEIKNLFEIPHNRFYKVQIIEEIAGKRLGDLDLTEYTVKDLAHMMDYFAIRIYDPDQARIPVVPLLMTKTARFSGGQIFKTKPSIQKVIDNITQFKSHSLVISNHLDFFKTTNSFFQDEKASEEIRSFIKWDHPSKNQILKQMTNPARFNYNDVIQRFEYLQIIKRLFSARQDQTMQSDVFSVVKSAINLYVEASLSDFASAFYGLRYSSSSSTYTDIFSDFISDQTKVIDMILASIFPLIQLQKGNFAVLLKGLKKSLVKRFNELPFSNWIAPKKEKKKRSCCVFHINRENIIFKNFDNENDFKYDPLKAILNTFLDHLDNYRNISMNPVSKSHKYETAISDFIANNKNNNCQFQKWLEQISDLPSIFAFFSHIRHHRLKADFQTEETDLAKPIKDLTPDMEFSFRAYDLQTWVSPLNDTNLDSNAIRSPSFEPQVFLEGLKNTTRFSLDVQIQNWYRVQDYFHHLGSGIFQMAEKLKVSWTADQEHPIFKQCEKLRQLGKELAFLCWKIADQYTKFEIMTFDLFSASMDFFIEWTDLCDKFNQKSKDGENGYESLKIIVKEIRDHEVVKNSQKYWQELRNSSRMKKENEKTRSDHLSRCSDLQKEARLMCSEMAIVQEFLFTIISQNPNLNYAESILRKLTDLSPPPKKDLFEWPPQFPSVMSFLEMWKKRIKSPCSNEIMDWMLKIGIDVYNESISIIDANFQVLSKDDQEKIQNRIPSAYIRNYFNTISKRYLGEEMKSKWFPAKRPPINQNRIYANRLTKIWAAERHIARLSNRILNSNDIQKEIFRLHCDANLLTIWYQQLIKPFIDINKPGIIKSKIHRLQLTKTDLIQRTSKMNNPYFAQKFGDNSEIQNILEKYIHNPEEGIAYNSFLKYPDLLRLLVKRPVIFDSKKEVIHFEDSMPTPNIPNWRDVVFQLFRSRDPHPCMQKDSALKSQEKDLNTVADQVKKEIFRHPAWVNFLKNLPTNSDHNERIKNFEAELQAEHTKLITFKKISSLSKENSKRLESLEEILIPHKGQKGTPFRTMCRKFLLEPKLLAEDNTNPLYNLSRGPFQIAADYSKSTEKIRIIEEFSSNSSHNITDLNSIYILIAMNYSEAAGEYKIKDKKNQNLRKKASSAEQLLKDSIDKESDIIKKEVLQKILELGIQIREWKQKKEFSDKKLKEHNLTHEQVSEELNNSYSELERHLQSLPSDEKDSMAKLVESISYFESVYIGEKGDMNLLFTIRLRNSKKKEKQDSQTLISRLFTFLNQSQYKMIDRCREIVWDPTLYPSLGSNMAKFQELYPYYYGLMNYFQKNESDFSKLFGDSLASIPEIKNLQNSSANLDRIVAFFIGYLNSDPKSKELISKEKISKPLDDKEKQLLERWRKLGEKLLFSTAQPSAEKGKSEISRYPTKIDVRNLINKIIKTGIQSNFVFPNKKMNEETYDLDSAFRIPLSKPAIDLQFDGSLRIRLPWTIDGVKIRAGFPAKNIIGWDRGLRNPIATDLPTKKFEYSVLEDTKNLHARQKLDRIENIDNARNLMRKAFISASNTHSPLASYYHSQSKLQGRHQKEIERALSKELASAVLELASEYQKNNISELENEFKSKNIPPEQANAITPSFLQINIENLSYMKSGGKGSLYAKEKNKWNRGLVVKYLEEFAAAQKIKIRQVAAAYSSQRCSNCNEIGQRGYLFVEDTANRLFCFTPKISRMGWNSLEDLMSKWSMRTTEEVEEVKNFQLIKKWNAWKGFARNLKDQTKYNFIAVPSGELFQCKISCNSSQVIHRDTNAACNLQKYNPIFQKYSVIANSSHRSMKKNNFTRLIDDLLGATRWFASYPADYTIIISELTKETKAQLASDTEGAFGARDKAYSWLGLTPEQRKDVITIVKQYFRENFSNENIVWDKLEKFGRSELEVTEINFVIDSLELMINNMEENGEIHRMFHSKKSSVKKE